MAKKNPTLSSLRQGQTVFYVHALGAGSFVTEYKVYGRPYISKLSGHYFIKRGEHSTSFLSLRDCNVVPNNYNRHRLFYKRGKAESYKRECVENDYDLSQSFEHNLCDMDYDN